MGAPATYANNYTNIVATKSVEPTNKVVLEYIKDAFVETIDSIVDINSGAIIQPTYYVITMIMNGLAANPKEQFKYLASVDRDADFATLIALFPSQSVTDIS